MEELEKIQKLEAPGYLLTRIEGKLESLKPLISWKLLAIYATVLLGFVFIQIRTSEIKSGNTAEQYAEEIGLNSNDYLVNYE
jgi:hypothetical protein